MTDEELAIFERVWTEAALPFHSAIEIDRMECRDQNFTGESLHAQVLALVAEVKRLRAERETVLSAVAEVVGADVPHHAERLMRLIRARFGEKAPEVTVTVTRADDPDPYGDGR
jgi:hypothetical protein